MSIDFDTEKDNKTILYYNLSNASLNTFKKSSPSNYRNILGEERIKQYELNNFPIELAIKFFNNSIAPSKKQGVFCCLTGYEWNIMLKEWLNQKNAKNIQTEVDIETKYGKTAIDSVCSFDNKKENKYKIVLPTLEETISIMNTKGEHSIEAKGTKQLPTKTITQIKKASTIYPNNHVFICNDTKVGMNIAKQIYNIGDNIDIIKSDMTKQDITKRLLNIQRQFRIVKQEHLLRKAN